MGLLNKTKTYLIGHIQCGDGRTWRTLVEKECGKMGIQCYNPYTKPFLKDIKENENVQQYMKDCMVRGEFDEVQEMMREIRIFDLCLTDKSDFLICYIDPKIPTYGTMEELSWAVRLKRPIFVAVEGGKQLCPLWILGMVPHKYVYSSIEDVMAVLTNIDSGAKKIDSSRWKLLMEEYR